MTKEKYYCTECEGNHYYESLIGVAHLEYKQLEEEEEPEQPAGPCPNLYWKQSHCGSCQGYYCAATSPNRRPQNEAYCKYEWIECPIYLGVQRAVTPTIIGIGKAEPPSMCKYQGPSPRDCKTCSGLYCYARMKQVKVVKTCRRPDVCGAYLQANWKGVPPYRK